VKFSKSEDVSELIDDMYDEIVKKKIGFSYIAVDLECSPQNRNYLWVGVTNGNSCWLFPVSKVAGHKDMYLSKFVNILGSSIIKIFHDYTCDKIMLDEFGLGECVLNVLDTKLIAIIKGEALSLENLAVKYNAGFKGKAKRFHHDLWNDEVLSEEEIKYLSNDVCITFKLCELIVRDCPNVVKNEHHDYKELYDKSISWIHTNKGGLPKTEDGLMNGLANNVVNGTYSGTELIRVAKIIFAMLKENRVITLSGGKVVYVTNDELFKQSTTKITCPGCENSVVKNANRFCTSCINTKVKPSVDEKCNMCIEKRDNICMSGVFCKKCLNKGYANNSFTDICSECRGKAKYIYIHGLKCRTCLDEIHGRSISRILAVPKFDKPIENKILPMHRIKFTYENTAFVIINTEIWKKNLAERSKTNDVQPDVVDMKGVVWQRELATKYKVNVLSDFRLIDFKRYKFVFSLSGMGKSYYVNNCDNLLAVDGDIIVEWPKIHHFWKTMSRDDQKKLGLQHLNALWDYSIRNEGATIFFNPNLDALEELIR
jgi:hypothetical protein